MNPRTNKQLPTPVAAQKTILLVDDDPSVRQMVGRVLREEGYLVLNAANGAEALGIAETNRIDLILLDLNMPVQNGWDTFERLTARDPLTAVIIITGRPNQLFTSLGAGVGALLEKPFNYPTLLKTVKSLLAESAELRIARLAGEHAGFHYHRATGPAVMAGRTK
jgi:DNA-binding response OmpR family regulator